MNTQNLVVRAVDVGYGHIKFTDGRHPITHAIRTNSFPSQSPAFKGAIMTAGGVLRRRDTFVIPVGGRLYEVGRDVHRALTGNNVTEVLDEQFALSDQYAARLFGALNYMLPNLPDNRIDVLVLGLPLNTYTKLHEALAKRFTGTFPINDAGEEVTIGSCHVYPQPMGSYMSYVLKHPDNKAPMALSIDPGYNTVDFFVCQGMSSNDTLNGAVPRGMGAVIRAVADDMKVSHDIESTPAELVRLIDHALSTGEPFKLFGKTVDLAPHMHVGNEVIQQAVQEIKNKVGAGSDIDVIILAGGGASLYEEAVRDKFPKHEVVTLEFPAHANVRGFHYIGELLARSLGNAMRLSGQAAA